MVRLSTRLAKLEQAGAGDLSAGAAKLLVELLGRRDALFYPTRSHKGRVAITQRQRAYLAGTEGVSAKADGAGAWKDSHYQRAELLRRGYVSASRSGGQVTSMYLTADGDAYSKSLVWDCPASKVLNEVHRALFLRLQRYDKNPWCGRKWVSEGELFEQPCTGDPIDWCDYTELMLPLLVAGLVVSNADAYGRVYYCATDAALPEIESVEFQPIANPAMTAFYVTAFRFESRALATAEPTDSNEIVIPIPASGW